VLVVDDLTILTGWAQAVAEALIYAPEHAATLVAEAKAGTPWRLALGVAEPSTQLSDAIQCLKALIGTSPTFDAALASAREDRAGEARLEGLARRVLRSTLEQIRARQAKEVNEYERP
jgi:hypothetical protein